jgi:hypothetical protein
MVLVLDNSDRYLGLIHGLGLMWREEGIKGLYRGYVAYLIAVWNLGT